MEVNGWVALSVVLVFSDVGVDTTTTVLVEMVGERGIMTVEVTVVV
jgi:hypothetical protein